MTMKWNWGTKLAIAMAAFMLMIIIFAVRMMRESVDLVEKDYYPKGQAYQQMIDKKANAAPYADSIHINIEDGFIKLRFPVSFPPEKITGTAHLYDRVTETGDKLFTLTVGAGGQFWLPVNQNKGRYIVKIDWVCEQKAYYVEKPIDL